MNWATAVAFCFFTASPAIAQVDAYLLHAKYGLALDRETFQVRPGIEMVVDYGPSRQACRIQLPSGMNFAGAVPPGSVSKKQIDEVIDEVVPPSTRGKLLDRMMQAMGAFSMSLRIYENVTIAETRNGDIRTGITVTFKDDACPKKNGTMTNLPLPRCEGNPKDQRAASSLIV
jgi:hypothetical protein